MIIKVMEERKSQIFWNVLVSKLCESGLIPFYPSENISSQFIPEYFLVFSGGIKLDFLIFELWWKGSNLFSQSLLNGKFLKISHFLLLFCIFRSIREERLNQKEIWFMKVLLTLNEDNVMQLIISKFCF